MAGGESNTASAERASVGGGSGNTASGNDATIAGGKGNEATGAYATIAGGNQNDAGYVGSVGGGSFCLALGNYAVVPGGDSNTAEGNYSFAAGKNAKVSSGHHGAFVWADSTGTDFHSSGQHTFNIRAANGVYVDANNAAYGARFLNQGSGDGIRTFSTASGGNTYAALYASNTGTSPGIYATSTAGPAAYFAGPVTVTGYLSKPGGGFTIDHPLDPANKTLTHSFVESPDMKNVYDGNVVLDAKGEATVEMPNWFEALNRDFRYQLTCIGGFAQVYIAEKIQDNRFRIAGGRAGLEVSWQVTGIRQDAWAKAHRIVVEQDKPADQRGTYLHPEVHGHSAPLAAK